MYDLRVEHFPKYAAQASKYKIYDMMDYKSDDDQAILDAIYEAFEVSGKRIDPVCLL